MSAEEQAVWDYAIPAASSLASFVILSAVAVLACIFGAVQILRAAS